MLFFTIIFNFFKICYIYFIFFYYLFTFFKIKLFLELPNRKSKEGECKIINIKKAVFILNRFLLGLILVY